MAKAPILLHDAYLGAILIKGIDGGIEALAGTILAVTGPQRVYGWVIRLTAPELSGGPPHPALHAIHAGAERLAGTPHHFVTIYLLVHGLLKLGIAVALLKGTARWIFPLGAVILAAFVAYMGWRLCVRWSGWLLGFALFDLVTLVLVLNEWRNPVAGAVAQPIWGERKVKRTL
ncbi:MAG: DUF2127 domain-containing protein [Rhizomicrobium sp.]